MADFKKLISIRWADLDPNFHVRHSVYYDFGAQQRIEILNQLGLTPQVMQEHHFGPIIFREECVFRREIRLSDTISISAKMGKLKPDASRWTIVHEFLSSEGGVVAFITLDGAWIDTIKRKLAVTLPKIVADTFNAFPRTDDFIML